MKCSLLNSGKFIIAVPGRNFVSVAAMVAAVCIGEGSFVTMPFIVGAISERLNFSSGAAAMVISFQFAFMAVTSGLLSAVVHKVDRRLLLLIAGVLIMFANGLAIASTDATWFLFSRACMGIGEGAALSVGYALAAGTRRPHHTFTIVTFAMVAMATPMYLSVPLVATHAGSLAVFYVLLAMAVICYPFLFGTQAHYTDDTPAKNADSSVWRPFPWVLLGICCLYISNNTLWAFSERIGSAMGLDLKTISNAFLATVIVTLIGPLAANLTQRKWSYVRPIVVAVTAQVIAIFTLVYAFNLVMFLVGIIFINALSLFLVPYYRSLTAFLDPKGRLASATTISQTVATAIGPFIGGAILLAGGNYAQVGWMASLFSIVSLLLIFNTARKAELFW